MTPDEAIATKEEEGMSAVTKTIIIVVVGIILVLGLAYAVKSGLITQMIGGGT